MYFIIETKILLNKNIKVDEHIFNEIIELQ